MKCPKCGTKTMFVLANIDDPAEILGCEECLPPELDGENIVELSDDDIKAMEDPVDEDGYSQAYWDDYDLRETMAIEEHYATRR